MPDFVQTATYEHSFWLHVLRDHSQFMLDALPSKQEEEIKIAKSFYIIFNDLFSSVNNSANINEITIQAEKNALALRDFKLSLLTKHITDANFKIYLTPTFLNHMVNELEEYLLVLSYLKQNQIPPIFHELHHHLLWVLDAAGHADAISSNLDGTEYMLRKKGHEFIKHFDHFYLKAVELTGYLRTKLNTFPALKRMNQDIKLEIQLFQIFLKEIEELDISSQMLSNFSALMADHMYREEVYYLQKLEESASTNT
ncbi:hypothetical protein CN692_11615 [Bacillus sp. AFS002410]|uniref:DUF2935 domain-containing protein n=1 Tax=Bacillus sp. AFS002410 TaxID=2033481 RepID=UPI000BEF299D|nr:DUF2935 domain-containing protein [Bacillus sp. AFS002410]PEJ57728.1 hypothetical protein CN692_11615 [Bacillus sp. AFS002410]